MPTRSNEQLCRLAQKGDTAARDILLEKNLGFIRKIALEQYRNMGWMKMILELIWMIWCRREVSAC